MKKSDYAIPSTHINTHQQQGISLLMVMLVLVLVALTSLSASRSSFFNETVTGNEADYNRALSAAESLIRDAQLDILGQTTAGAPCNVAVNFIGCRASPTGIPSQLAPYFPEDAAEANALHLALAAPNYCSQGICSPPPLVWPPVGPYPLLDNFWLTPATLIANQAFAATYGQFTGAAPAATGNPILTAIPRRAWYWTELVDFSVNLCIDPAYVAMCSNRPATNKPFIYRITAVAQGRGATIAAIQTFYIPYPQ